MARFGFVRNLLNVEGAGGGDFQPVPGDPVFACFSVLDFGAWNFPLNWRGRGVANSDRRGEIGDGVSSTRNEVLL